MAMILPITVPNLPGKDNGLQNLKKTDLKFVMVDNLLIQIKKHLTQGNVLREKCFQPLQPEQLNGI
jgi:hypothetical protein